MTLPLATYCPALRAQRHARVSGRHAISNLEGDSRCGDVSWIPIVMPGKLLVGQAGGATAVINASLTAVIEEASARGIAAIWGMRRGVEGALAGDLVDLTHTHPADLHRLRVTPGAALGASRHKVSDDDIDRLLDVCVAHEIRAFLYIGGNDSADTVHRIGLATRARAYELSAIAIPKTIDNDLPITDHCPGFPSIARYVAVATMDSAQDTESMPTMYPVKFIEVMGRDAGWVAAATGLARVSYEDAPHLVYLPEYAVTRDQLLADVDRVYRELGRVVAVVAETVRDAEGRPFADPSLSGEVDAFGHPLLRGTADTMCRLVMDELGLRARYDKPGSLQRMSSYCASPIDRDEAAAVGRAAVRLAVSGESDVMVTLVRTPEDPYRSTLGIAPLSAIANHQRLLPGEYFDPASHTVTPAFHRYVMPLLGPDPFPRYARLHAPAVDLFPSRALRG